MNERHPAASDAFDPRTHYQRQDVAEGYDRARFFGVTGAIVNMLERRMVMRTLRAMDRVESVLDVPSGTGRLIPALHAAGYQVIGADVSSAMLGRAHTRAGALASLLHAEGERLPLRDDSVDVVLCVRLFPHLSADARLQMLREFARVSARGVVAVYQPHRMSVWYAIRNKLQRKRLPRYSVSDSDARAEFAAAGLRVEASFAMLPAIFMERAYVLASDQR